MSGRAGPYQVLQYVAKFISSTRLVTRGRGVPSSDGVRGKSGVVVAVVGVGVVVSVVCLTIFYASGIRYLHVGPLRGARCSTSKKRLRRPRS